MIKQLSPEQAFSSVTHIIATLFPGRHLSFFKLVFEKTESLFEGKYPGYQGCDTAYHNFSHTCDAMLATALILDGHIRSDEAPSLTPRDFELAMAAALLHDSGLIKETGDNEGTGAKHAPRHVARGAHFARQFLAPLDVKTDEIQTVQLAIRCTELDAKIASIEFRDERERFLGCVVAAGDLLGQMAAADYPKRLPLLYAEYREAMQSVRTHYTDATDLLRQTRSFYETHVTKLLNTQWTGVNRALTHHFPSGRNELIDAIENNLARIDLVLTEAQSVSSREHHHA